jgi:hypothetical protein
MHKAPNGQTTHTSDLDNDQQDSAQVAGLAASQVHPESSLPSRPDYDAAPYLTGTCPSTSAVRFIDVMIDIETLGTTPGSAILSLGAVMFGPTGLGEEFYAPISLASCSKAGLAIDPGTVAWWMKQSDAARAAAFRDDVEPLPVALQQFTRWFELVEAERPWCQGANFDAPLLEAAYRACGMTPPWKYWAVRDTRTLYELADVRVDRALGTHHNALDDARAQAEAAVVALQRLQDVRATIADPLARAPLPAQGGADAAKMRSTLRAIAYTLDDHELRAAAREAYDAAPAQAGDELDAARYRWLRDRGMGDQSNPADDALLVYRGFGESSLLPDQLDDAIDAAMSASQGKTGGAA